MFLICSCNINNPIPKYTDIIVTEKQTNTLMKFNGKVSLNNVNKYGDTVLFVDNITECRYSIDSLIVCDQTAKKDTFSIFINEKQYVATRNITILGAYYYLVYPCKKFQNGYICF